MQPLTQGDLRSFQDRCHLDAVLEPTMPKDERALPPLYDSKLVLMSPTGCKPAVDTLDGFREGGGG